jgi:hypothetical protein
MRLANLRSFKFSDLNFYHYFFTAYIGLHVTFSLLLGKIMAFAPDENLYRDIFSRLYQPGFTSDVLGFGGAWVPWLKIIYSPAKLFTYLGFTDLMAIRLLAIGYSCLATYLVVRIAKDNKRDDRIFRIGLLAISFIPTVFLWSSIGLRECFLYLALSTILFSVNRIRIEPNWYWFMAFSFAFLSLSQTKPYIYVILLIAILFSVIIDAVRMRQINVIHIAITTLAFMPLLVHPTLAETVKSGGKTQLVTIFAEEPIVNSENLVVSRGITVQLLVDQLNSDPGSLISRIAIKLGITSRLVASIKSSTVVVGSEDDKINKSKLSSQRATFASLNSLPQAIYRFMFVPLIFMDNGSLFLNIQSIETPVWVFMYLLFFITIYQIMRSRRELDLVVTAAVVFAVEFIFLSALTEINVGTALRHRSLLLIPILVIWVARKKKPHLSRHI